MVLYQAWNDIKKEGMWVWIYFIMMTAAVMMLFSQLDTLSAVWRKNVHLYQFEKENVFCAELYEVCLSGETAENTDLKEEFLEEERFGGFCILENDSMLNVKYQCDKVVVLTGCYVK